MHIGPKERISAEYDACITTKALPFLNSMAGLSIIVALISALTDVIVRG